jgi:hypothetical protein
MRNDNTTVAEINEISSFIICLFKLAFLNEEGLISRTLPVSERTIFDNLDDIAPFLIYFGETDFLLVQTYKLKESSFESLLSDNNVLYAAKTDEYLGGLNAIFRETKDVHVKRLLDDAVSKCLRYFLVEDNHFAECFDFTRRRESSYFSPWSAGLLETFLEISDLYPELTEIVERILRSWIGHDFFQKYGLFPFRASFSPVLEWTGRRSAKDGRWCYHYPYMEKYQPQTNSSNLIQLGSTALRKGVHSARLFRRWAKYSYFESGHWAQLMKSNTTPAFTMIELYCKTGDDYWKETLKTWVLSVKRNMVKSDGVHGTFFPPGKIGEASLTDGFILIDVLCDAWNLVERDPKYLDLARDVAEKCLSWRWENGLVPMNPNGEWDHLDNQVDFSISLRRVGELTKMAEFLEGSVSVMNSALALHRTNEGFSTHVDKKGAPVTLHFNAVDPKYNGLLLKGLIHLETMDREIYSSDDLMDLFKDR